MWPQGSTIWFSTCREQPGSMSSLKSAHCQAVHCALSIITEKLEASGHCEVMFLLTQKECHLVLLNRNIGENLIISFQYFVYKMCVSRPTLLNKFCFQRLYSLSIVVQQRISKFSIRKKKNFYSLTWFQRVRNLAMPPLGASGSVSFRSSPSSCSLPQSLPPPKTQTDLEETLPHSFTQLLARSYSSLSHVLLMIWLPPE